MGFSKRISGKTLYLQIKMENISLDSRTKDFRRNLTFNISKICQNLFSSLKNLKLKILKKRISYLEPLSEDKNLIFDFKNQLILVDYFNFDTHLAGMITQISTTGIWFPIFRTARKSTIHPTGTAKLDPHYAKTSFWTPTSSY